MPRPILIALIAFVATANLYGQEPPRPSPAVKRILDKAVAEVKKNRQEFDKANEAPLSTASKDLKDLATKLLDDGKTAEAQAVLKQVDTLNKDVLGLANAPAPMAGGGAGPQKPLEGKWDRDEGSYWLLKADGTAEVWLKKGDRLYLSGKYACKADGEVDFLWESGHQMKGRCVGDDWIALRETQGGKTTGDGVVLQRIE